MAERRKPRTAPADERRTFDQFCGRFLGDWQRLDPADRERVAARIALSLKAMIEHHGNDYEILARARLDGFGELAAMISTISMAAPTTPVGLVVRHQYATILAARPKLAAHEKLSQSKPNVKKVEADERLKRDGMTVEEIAKENKESFYATKQRRYRAGKRQRDMKR